jgi:aspartate/glutamate/glutamine transport system ATP-binding protein
LIEFREVNKHYGHFHVLKNIDLSVKQGEVVVVIGPSGSGKSTKLRCINRLETISSGELLVEGVKINGKRIDVSCRNKGWNEESKRVARFYFGMMILL